MTDKDIFDKISETCICSKCKHKKSISYEPIKDENDSTIGFKNVMSACHKRTPGYLKGVDGKYGFHSLPIPKDHCCYFENKDGLTMAEEALMIEDSIFDIKKMNNLYDTFLKKDCEQYDKLMSSTTLEDLLDL